MTNREKVEGYMIKLGLTFQEIDEKTWIINDDDEGIRETIVTVDDPLVLIRVNVMDIPPKNQPELFEELLRLNANDLIHGAYALEDDLVILVDSLQSNTMDIEEFQASLDAVGLALAQHYPILSKYRH